MQSKAPERYRSSRGYTAPRSQEKPSSNTDTLKTSRADTLPLQVQPKSPGDSKAHNSPPHDLIFQASAQQPPQDLIFSVLTRPDLRGVVPSPSPSALTLSGPWPSTALLAFADINVEFRGVKSDMPPSPEGVMAMFPNAGDSAIPEVPIIPLSSPFWSAPRERPPEYGSERLR